MSFKFLVGQAVEYTPIGEKKPGLFKIVCQMPKEDQAFDVYHRIKSEAEEHERNVAECQLGPDTGIDSSFAAITSPPVITTVPRQTETFHRDLLSRSYSSARSLKAFAEWYGAEPTAEEE